MGKAYTHRKSIENRPQNDFYPTPKFLIDKLIESDIFKSILNEARLIAEKEHRKLCILEPACGDKVISKALEKLPFPFDILNHDIRTDGIDFLSYSAECKIDLIITNPPFSLWDSFVNKAKEISPKIIFIGKTNFFGAYKRYKEGVWNNLREVFVFNRQVDYRTGREDGKFKCGNLITGWFLWDRDWINPYWHMRIMDVQDGVIKEPVK